MSDESVRRSFEAIAEAYARDFADELDRKPFDREILSRFAARVGAGRVLDIGCGPGQVGDFVAAHDPSVIGVDFSARSLAQGRALYPRLRFVGADFGALPFHDASLDGIVAFYSLIYVTDEDAARAIAEWRRVLRHGAALLVAVHAGTGEDHFADYKGTPIDVTIRWRDPERFPLTFPGAGYTVEAVTERPPYPDEHPSRRLYIEAVAR